MTLIRRPSPFGELLSLRQAMDRLFDEPSSGPSPVPPATRPRAMPLDIYATADALVLEAALPGVKPEDVDSLDPGRHPDPDRHQRDRSARVDEGGYHVQEVRRGRFTRTVAAAVRAQRTDAATATFENGILRLADPQGRAGAAAPDPA